MKSVMLVAIGGAIGSVARYFVALLFKEWLNISYPIHTIIVNIIGCFFIGFIATQVLKFNNPDNVRLFVIMGVLGGFTTFSSYSFEVMQMFKNRMFAQALLYFLGSNTLCICAAYLGYSIKL